MARTSVLAEHIAMKRTRAAGLFPVIALVCATAAVALAGDSAPAAHQLPWSFKPVGRVAPPAGDAAGAIDRFILAGMREKGLAPAAPADKLVLLRRARFDLTGLPPTREEIESFPNDTRSDAFARLIDSLLDSTEYGERWGKHWLDVVRYADTGGFEKDHLYPSAYKYRDYVIRSFNADKPFDRFIEEQVAGDELWPDDKDALTATGLYCVGPAVDEAAMMSAQLEYEWRTDSVDTTAAAFLGLTAGCARCHDHKYDPISQKDYFSLQAVFADSDRPWPQALRLLRIKGLNGLLSDGPVPNQYLADPRCTLYTEDKTGFHLFHRAEPMEMHVLRRGQLSTPGDKVSPDVPNVLKTEADKDAFASVKAEGRRAALARWIASPDNPLTARVIVNRVWAWHFGEGLVRTPNDFGNQGEGPTHPELLDYLARDFTEHGWSIKRLHRQIMLSAAYQRGSLAGPEAARLDPENKLLSHFPRQRIDGESIRDALLACAGTLNPKRYGPAVVPPLGAEELAGLFDAKSKWPVTKDTAEHTRRSVYLLVRRTFVLPMFASFDAPDVMASCARRYQTTVPTQALTLLNSGLVREQATAMAKRIAADCGDDVSKQIAEGWQLCFGRPVTKEESDKAAAFVNDRAGLTHDREAALAELCLALFNANEFVYVD
jgi:hypothetical protein